jgi:hypothetical protein
MPEATEGLSNALARGSLYEIGASTRYAGTMLTEAEAEAQRAAKQNMLRLLGQQLRHHPQQWQQ